MPVQVASPASIWSLPKEKAIKHLLLALNQRLGDDAFAFCVDDPPDPRAIRVFHPHELHLGVRIFTFGQNHGRYGLQLEYPELPDNRPELTNQDGEDLPLERTLEIIAIHLDLTELPDYP
ncbi:MAG TPA: hypothetical protein VI279_11235 [Rhodocyclaceae bacterium]